jgi:hypothetical protein
MKITSVVGLGCAFYLIILAANITTFYINPILSRRGLVVHLDDDSANRIGTSVDTSLSDQHTTNNALLEQVIAALDSEDARRTRRDQMMVERPRELLKQTQAVRFRWISNPEAMLESPGA